MYSNDSLNYTRVPDMPSWQYGIDPDMSNPQLQYSTPTNQPAWTQQTQMQMPGTSPYLTTPIPTTPTTPMMPGMTPFTPSLGGPILPAQQAAVPTAQPGAHFHPGMSAPGFQFPTGVTMPGMQPAPGMPMPGMQIPTTIPVTGAAPVDFDLLATGAGTPVMDTEYTQGYLKTQIGRRVKVEFLIGTGMLVDREGTLVDVGISYIIINEVDTDDLLLCDIYAIKFVKFYY